MGLSAYFEAPIDGLGRYFETPAAAAAGERFEIVGAEGDYQAPVAGLSGRRSIRVGGNAMPLFGHGRRSLIRRSPYGIRVGGNARMFARRGLKGVGAYFETPAGVRAGEVFDIEGANSVYQAPVEGLSRYFETDAAARSGMKFDITGVNYNYQAPMAGLGEDTSVVETVQTEIKEEAAKPTSMGALYVAVGISALATYLLTRPTKGGK